MRVCFESTQSTLTAVAYEFAREVDANAVAFRTEVSSDVQRST